MMFAVTITNGSWLRAGEEKIMRRIADIAIGREAVIERRTDGSKWHLDVTGNDWFADELRLAPDGRSGTIHINYRYGFGGNAGVMDQLQAWLNWVFK